MRISELVGPNQAVQIFGLKLVGVNAENGKKLLFSAVFVTLILLLNFVLKRAVSSLPRERQKSGALWVRQGTQVVTAVILLVGLISIWFNEPARLTTAMGLVTAGLAFALQRVVTAVAGYIVILRGNTFSVGDRIVMGGVRGM